MRVHLYDISGLALIGLSIYFFYRSVAFLVAGDYVGGITTMVIGFFVIRVGVELSKLAAVAGEDDAGTRS